MIDRAYLKTFLEINNISPAASDEEIKSVLVSAHWHEDDVDTTLTILRENPNDKKQYTDTIHKVFRNDDRLNPESISALLGIDVQLDSAQLAEQRRRARGDLSMRSMMFLLLISSLLSLLCVLATMWHLEIGLFYYSAAL